MRLSAHRPRPIGGLDAFHKHNGFYRFQSNAHTQLPILKSIPGMSHHEQFQIFGPCRPKRPLRASCCPNIEVPARQLAIIAQPWQSVHLARSRARPITIIFRQASNQNDWVSPPFIGWCAWVRRARAKPTNCRQSPGPPCAALRGSSDWPPARPPPSADQSGLLSGETSLCSYAMHLLLCVGPMTERSAI